MTDAARTPIVVLGVTPGDRPFRLVQINGITVGAAHDLLDVIKMAHREGLQNIDLDDPAWVRWVGGGKYKWNP
ncbi:hypothetical protein GCM10020367_68220 [Streptomyces sannanensis]|uniref:Uncharacterized protein n=1 Tax=Streptomyces sannanensis TaxID=285536 RepID=A0ABP6S4C2_9ACTN